VFVWRWWNRQRLTGLMTDSFDLWVSFSRSTVPWSASNTKFTIPILLSYIAHDLALCYIVQSFLSCRLGYSRNALLYGISGRTRRHGSSLVLPDVTAETAPLVACETENWFQIGVACLQVIAWSCSAVPVGRLSTRHGRGTSTSQVFRRLHVCRPADTVTDWRQEFLCRRTAAMEQPTDRDPEERHYLRISNIIDDT